MNEIFLTLGIESWKPYLSVLLLPPVPLLVLVLVGARLMFRRRLLAWLLVLLSVVGLWLSCTTAVGYLLQTWALKAPPALTQTQVNDLKKAPRTAILVLGGGRRLRAPEYGMSTLNELTAERLRYGIWLSRETGLPLALPEAWGMEQNPAPPRRKSWPVWPNASTAGRCAGLNPSHATPGRTRPSPCLCCTHKAWSRWCSSPTPSTCPGH